MRKHRNSDEASSIETEFPVDHRYPLNQGLLQAGNVGPNALAIMTFSKSSGDPWLSNKRTAKIAKFKGFFAPLAGSAVYTLCLTLT